ncbi:ganglioside-induced differentiation-associated protein 1-like isoform X2 [Mytilus edulis]|uniref:ganglioside-induced differentiation-associated protein 1-like isoform X2 n=1 Tax=Mytilus edulis TaxID=6550 RepID=UPI0039EEA64F
MCINNFKMSDNRFTLYYFHGSYYSQKALLALFEKGCQFNRKFINIHTGEQKTPEYMKMNPLGQVPLLKDGEEVIVESEKIIDYIDEEIKSGPILVPDLNTPVGKEVQRLRQFIGGIRIEITTFGLFFNPDLSTSGVKVPKSYLKHLKGSSEKNVNSLEEAALKYPDLRDSYIAKAEKSRQFFADAANKELVVQCLEEIEQKCDHLEECLRKSKNTVQGDEFWLTGPDFNAADILLVVFMDRMVKLGLEGRYFCETKRPLLYDYFQRIGHRQSVQLLRTEVKKLVSMFIWNRIKATVPYVAALGLTIGLGVWFMKNKSAVINLVVKK